VTPSSVPDAGGILGLLKDEFPLLRKKDLRPDTPLLSAGLLDSFAIVTLVAALDAAFAVDIDVEQTELEAFETASTIAALCARASERATPPTTGGHRA
jgi:acyl carrier protein